jgi:hypothetical protein
MTDHVEILQQAREQMVKARRKIAEELSKPYSSNTTPGSRSAFIDIQNTIEQIDKAIADERKNAPRAPVKVSAKNPYGEIDPNEDIKAPRK